MTALGTLPGQDPLAVGSVELWQLVMSITGAEEYCHAIASSVFYKNTSKYIFLLRETASAISLWLLSQCRGNGEMAAIF